MNEEQRNYRSRQKNRQDPVGKAVLDNRANQKNPNNPASKPSNPGHAPKGRDSGNR